MSQTTCIPTSTKRTIAAVCIAMLSMHTTVPASGLMLKPKMMSALAGSSKDVMALYFGEKLQHQGSDMEAVTLLVYRTSSNEVLPQTSRSSSSLPRCKYPDPQDGKTCYHLKAKGDFLIDRDFNTLSAEQYYLDLNSEGRLRTMVEGTDECLRIATKITTKRKKFFYDMFYPKNAQIQRRNRNTLIQTTILKTFDTLELQSAVRFRGARPIPGTYTHTGEKFFRAIWHWYNSPLNDPTLRIFAMQSLTDAVKKALVESARELRATSDHKVVFNWSTWTPNSISTQLDLMQPSEAELSAFYSSAVIQGQPTMPGEIIGSVIEGQHL